MVTAQFFRRSAYVGVALAAFLATSFLIHSLLPPMIPKGIAAKLEFFIQQGRIRHAHRRYEPALLFHFAGNFRQDNARKWPADSDV
jgi:hypothetical protein